MTISSNRSTLTVYGRESKEERDYWLDKLSRERGASNLSTDYERPEEYLGQRESVEVVLPDELCRKLEQITGDSPFLIYTALHAALKICLHKYMGERTIVVGSPARQTQGGRAVKENALAVIDDVNGDLTAREFLSNVRGTLLEAYGKQHYPFTRLLQDLDLDGVVNRCPLFDVALALTNIHAALPEVKNDITITLGKSGGEVSGTASFNPTLFKRESVERFSKHFLCVLREMLENPAATISELRMLAPGELHQVLYDWNDTRAEFPSGLCAHHLFERQAASTPEAAAVICGDEALTYRQLDERATRLARRLCAHGVHPDTLVAVFVERSAAMVVGLLAVLKAGGAYVPFDPDYPQERLAWMLEDARPRVVLTSRRFAGRLSAGVTRVLYLDDEAGTHLPADEEGAHGEAPPAVAPENLAYVIYTSGSTGRPKGVMVTHRNLTHSTYARLLYYPEPPARYLLLSSFAFDSSVAGLFWTLWGGGALVLPREGEQRDAAALAALVEREGVTHLLGLPPLYAAMLEAAGGSGGERLRSLRAAIVAGETCPPDLVRRHANSEGGAALYNEYGPTEATVWCSAHRCVSETGEAERREPAVPIGKAIANARLYVLDKGMRPVGVGAKGEIYVGGEGVSRGYLGRAGVTAERFVPDPFSGEAGARLYRTGDVGRHLWDGSVEYAGRIDEQVKVRGYRIELGEVEAALRGHEWVRECAAAVREDGADKQLIGYVVTEQEKAHVTEELRNYLKERLPEYMVPSRLVWMKELPLTPNGKVDRRALPAPEQAQTGEAAYVPPRTPAEELLAGIWADVLKLERVSVHANFFDIGGHSLIATQIMSRVREAFAVELPVRVLFGAPTVSGLSEAIEAQMKKAVGINAPPIQPTGGAKERPLSFAQQRLWFADQLTPNRYLYNISATVRLTGELNVSALGRALSEVVHRHEALRTTFREGGGEVVQVVSAAEPVPLPVHDLSPLAEGERERAVRDEALRQAREGFDLRRGSLLRAELLRLGEREHVFLLTMHHIVSDGWSMGILIQELGALYEAYSRGERSPLAELQVQYGDYAEWQLGWMSGEVLAQEVAWWRERLRGGEEVLRLPVDRERNSEQRYVGGEVGFEVDEGESEALRALSRREGCTLFMTLLAAFKVLLFYYSKQEEIVVGTNVANRNRAEIEGLIGFFVNTLALRTGLAGNPTFRELLGRVRGVALEAYAHEDLPFEKLVAALQLERDLSRSPVFQVKLEFGNDPHMKSELDGLTLRPLDFGSDVVRYDLHLFMRESGEKLTGKMVYDVALFNAATVEMMTGHLTSVLRAVVAEPDTRLDALTRMLAAQEREHQAEKQREYEESIGMRFKRVRRRSVGEDARLEV